jgi:hypothetical protein
MINLTREEAAKMLHYMDDGGTYTDDYGKLIEILRARLSAPEPTLVLWNVKSNRLASPSDDRAQVFAIRKREWQGLTDEEIEAGFITNTCCDDLVVYEHIARAIEAKLKEKNT